MSLPELFTFSQEFKDSLYAKHISFVRLCERLEFYEDKAVEHQLRVGEYLSAEEADVERYFDENTDVNPWDAKADEILDDLPDSPQCIEEYLSTQACVIELMIEDELPVPTEALPSLYQQEAHLFNASMSDYAVKAAQATGLSPMISGSVEDFVADMACVTAFANPSVALADAIAMTEAAVNLGLLQLKEMSEDNNND